MPWSFYLSTYGYIYFLVLHNAKFFFPYSANLEAVECAFLEGPGTENLYVLCVVIQLFKTDRKLSRNHQHGLLQLSM